MMKREVKSFLIFLTYFLYARASRYFFSKFNKNNLLVVAHYPCIIPTSCPVCTANSKDKNGFPLPLDPGFSLQVFLNLSMHVNCLFFYTYLSCVLSTKFLLDHYNNTVKLQKVFQSWSVNYVIYFCTSLKTS